MEKLGFVILTFADLPFAAMAEVARKAEGLGYERVYTIREEASVVMTCRQLICRVVFGRSA